MDASARVDGVGWKSSGNRSCLVMRKGRLVGPDVQSGEGGQAVTSALPSGQKGGQAASGQSYQGLELVRLSGQGNICLRHRRLGRDRRRIAGTSSVRCRI